MKRFGFWFILVLGLALVPTPASADEPKLADVVQKRVEEGLAKQLEAQRVSFSRARPVPVERRVRALALVTTADQSGNTFVSFAIDTRQRGVKEWQEKTTQGCVYVPSGQIYVLIGAKYYPGEIMLGKKVDEAQGVCRPPPPSRA